MPLPRNPPTNSNRREKAKHTLEWVIIHVCLYISLVLTELSRRSLFDSQSRRWFGALLALPRQKPPIVRPRRSEGIARSTPWSLSLAVVSVLQFGWNYIAGAGRVVRFAEV